MSSAYFCVSVDDIGLPGYSSPEHLKRLLDFWDEQGLKGTLFVVPRCDGKEIGQMKEYVELLYYALENGHEIAQHGLDHTRFQTGIPPKMVLDLPHEGPAREYLSKNRSQIESLLSMENLRKVLGDGRDILESIIHKPIHGFRAPCLSTCPNLFKALKTEGYTYDSSCVFQESAWKMIVEPEKSFEPCPINKSLFDAFQISGNIQILPISAEYTWYLKQKNFETFLNLAKHDLDCCFAEKIPFVSLCHVSPIQEGDTDIGFKLYRELISYARNRAEKQGVSFVAKSLFCCCKA